jgi:5,10-methylenetetrahydromethanopterin reductase
MSTTIPKFGFNRFDARDEKRFVASVQQGESLGFDYAFIPSSPLLIRDPYLMLALAACVTERIAFGPLLENPVVRHPGVIAGSMASLERMVPGRTLLGIGVGDTAVRSLGLRPARVAELEAAITLIRTLADGEQVSGSRGVAHRLRHHARFPVWVCAGGPRTLEMAGRTADGVFIRVGTHANNIEASLDAIHRGARANGRDPSDIQLGAIFHTVLSDDPHVVETISRSAAAGYYEYTPELLHRTGESWNGPDVDELKRQIWQDFHHTPDLVAAGELVGFLSDTAARSFALSGNAAEVRAQLTDILDSTYPFDIVVLHPMCPPGAPQPEQHAEFMAAVGNEVIAPMRD